MRVRRGRRPDACISHPEMALQSISSLWNYSSRLASIAPTVSPLALLLVQPLTESKSPSPWRKNPFQRWYRGCKLDSNSPPQLKQSLLISLACVNRSYRRSAPQVRLYMEEVLLWGKLEWRGLHSANIRGAVAAIAKRGFSRGLRNRNVNTRPDPTGRGFVVRLWG